MDDTLSFKNRQCALEESFKMFANRWKPFIMYECSKHDICSFSDFKNAIKGISDTALDMQLKRLIEDNLVQKTPNGYKLTSKGIDLLPIWSSLYAFAIENGYTEVKGNCAISYTKELIGSKWTSRILWILHNQRPTRFNELQKSIEGISHKVLKEKLNGLEQIGFVTREDHGTKSPWVDYYLTKKGEKAYDIMENMHEFSYKHGLLSDDTI